MRIWRILAIWLLTLALPLQAVAVVVPPMPCAMHGGLPQSDKPPCHGQASGVPADEAKACSACAFCAAAATPAALPLLSLPLPLLCTGVAPRDDITLPHLAPMASGLERPPRLTALA